MKSNLEVNGVYDPTKRFAFTNITEEPFESAWNGSPIIIKAGDTIELQHHLAVKLTGELVDKIMIGKAKLNEVEFYKTNPNTAPNTYRAPSTLGVPSARKFWEDQILRELEVDEESPEIQIMRAKIKEELLADMSKDKSSEPAHVPDVLSSSEFVDLTNGKGKEQKPPKPPIKVKSIKVE